MSESEPTVRDIDLRAEWPFIGVRRRRESRHERIISTVVFTLGAAVSAVAGSAAIAALFAAGAGYAFNSWLKWIDIYGGPQ